MGVLFINLEGEYNFQTQFYASAERNSSRSSSSSSSSSFFENEHDDEDEDDFLLGIIFIPRKKEAFFETGGKVSANIAVKCQGTRCESGTVAPL
jgi:hypothetical protein